MVPTIKDVNDRLTETIIALNKQFKRLTDDINARVVDLSSMKLHQHYRKFSI